MGEKARTFILGWLMYGGSMSYSCEKGQAIIPKYTAVPVDNGNLNK